MKQILLSTSILIVLILVAPLMLTLYGVNLATEIAIMAIFAMSLGLILGYAGMVTLGHAAFFGIGAYTVAIVGQYFSNTYLLLIISLVLSGMVALITGAIFIRTSQFYFLMITLAFGQMVYALVYKSSWTGGDNGTDVSASLDFGFGEVVSPIGFYLVMCFAFVLFYVFLRFFVDSPTGKIVKGIMENESRMQALGYNTRVYKLLVYTISGMIAGLAGSFYAYFNMFVSPGLTNWTFSGEALLMIIIGGVGTLFGPVIGAGFYVILQSYISSYTEYWLLILGIILVTLVLIGRGGIIHWIQLLGKSMFLGKKESQQNQPKDQIKEEKV